MTAFVATELRRYTAEEYLDLEKNAEIKHEFYYGKLIPMPGESKNANLISTNLTVRWTLALRQQGYHTFGHDIKVTVKSGEVYRYPDFMVAPKTDQTHDYLVTEPVLLAEVASESSWHTDSLVKLREYLALPSLKYYLIISQEEMHVEFCYLEGDKWHFKILTHPADVLELPFFGLEITLAELYEEVQLEHI